MRVLMIATSLVFLSGYCLLHGGEQPLTSQISNNASHFLGPNQLKDTAALGSGQPRDCSDSAQATHPSIILADSDSFPKKYWMAYSPVTSCRGAGDENPRIVCSDDGINWSCEVAPDKFIRNPVFVAADISRDVNYLSDPELFWIDSMTMGLVFRARFGVQITDSVALFVSKSNNGVNWSDPKPMLVDREVAITESSLMSPAVFKGEDGQFNMMVVEGRIDADSHNMVHRYVSSSLDSAWRLVDSVNLGRVSNSASAYKQNIWHLEIIPTGGKKLVGLFTMGDIVSQGANATLYIGTSHDSGHSWVLSDDPVLRPKKSSWDSDVIYRSSGYIKPGQESDSLYIYYSALGGPSKTWHVGITTFQFGPHR